jgi:hypothetical protein
MDPTLNSTPRKQSQPAVLTAQRIEAAPGRVNGQAPFRCRDTACAGMQNECIPAVSGGENTIS